MHTVKPSNEDFTITPKIAFLNSVFIFAGITSLGLGIYRWQSSQLMGTICFAFALYNFAFLFYLRRHKQRIEIIASSRPSICWLPTTQYAFLYFFSYCHLLFF